MNPVNVDIYRVLSNDLMPIPLASSAVGISDFKSSAVPVLRRIALAGPKLWCNEHTSADQTPITCVPVASPGFKLKGRV